MIYVITGPTCTGKDAFAIELAKRLGGEIINADAFHVYKGLIIGTNKPKEEDFQGVKHHLFDFIELDDNYSIARYQKDARLIIEDLLDRNIPIIMLGGSGLYIKAALFDYRFKEEDKIDMAIYDAMDNKTLHESLKAIDHAAANNIHPNNRRRVMRAIQIFLAQGIRKSDIPILRNERPLYECMFFGIEFDRGDLYLLIVSRVTKMMNEGLIREVKQLSEKYGDNQQAFNAIGYKEIIEHLQGITSKEEALSNIISNTRHYAKRQITFFRHQFDMHWVKTVDDIIRIAHHGKTS